MSALPAGWEQVAIGEVAEVNPRPSADPPSDDTLVSFVPMAACEAKSGRLDASETRPFGELRKKSFRRFEEGDVVVAKITPSMENGKAALARNLVGGQAFGTTEFHVLRTGSRLDARYLLHFVLQQRFRGEAASHMTGTAGQLRVPAEFLRQAPIPLPPLDEQQRIVEVIEEQFSRLDAGVESLQRAKRNLTRLRASVLKAAVDGDLLEKAGKPKRPANKLPEGWRWATVADVGDVDLGRQRSPKYHTGRNMRPYLRVANVFENRIDLSDVMEMDFPPEQYPKYRLAHGDILLNEGQSPELVGRPAMYRDEMPGVCFTNSLIRFRPRDGVVGDFALLVFRSHLRSGRFRREARITTNIAHLSTARFKSVEFPVPPPEEQKRIVAEAQRQESIIDALEREVAVALARGRLLQQAILTAAFSGDLKAGTWGDGSRSGKKVSTS